jgi:hypothetical protein
MRTHASWLHDFRPVRHDNVDARSQVNSRGIDRDYIVQNIKVRIVDEKKWLNWTIIRHLEYEMMNFVNRRTLIK